MGHPVHETHTVSTHMVENGIWKRLNLFQYEYLNDINRKLLSLSQNLILKLF